MSIPVKPMLWFNEDAFIRSHSMLIGAIKEHIFKRSYLESRKNRHIFNNVSKPLPTAIRNSFAIVKEVNDLFLKINSVQCSNVLSSDSSHSNYPVISSEFRNHSETRVSDKSIYVQISSGVISHPDYLNDSLVSSEVLNEFGGNISNKTNTRDIITNFACSHNAFISSENLSQNEAQILYGFKSNHSSYGPLSNVIYPHNPFTLSQCEKYVLNESHSDHVSDVIVAHVERSHTSYV